MGIYYSHFSDKYVLHGSGIGRPRVYCIMIVKGKVYRPSRLSTQPRTNKDAFNLEWLLPQTKLVPRTRDARGTGAFYGFGAFQFVRNHG